MITEEQRDRLTTKNVLAVLTRDYKPRWLDYILLEGTVVEITVWKYDLGDLYINDECVDYCFPYDAAELLEGV